MDKRTYKTFAYGSLEPPSEGMSDKAKIGLIVLMLLFVMFTAWIVKAMLKQPKVNTRPIQKEESNDVNIPNNLTIRDGRNPMRRL